MVAILIPPKGSTTVYENIRGPNVRNTELTSHESQPATVSTQTKESAYQPPKGVMK